MTNSVKNYFAGVGRRKSAVAQVRVEPGRFELIINKESHRPKAELTNLLELTDMTDRIKIEALIKGGGITSRQDALYLGVARALVKFNPDLLSTLRKAGFLTRDSRVKERKKPGLKRARRAPQWAKR